jgi:NADPH:quinone reductase-like Zn-dependent oxidoreductase
MQAMVLERHGGPEVLERKQVEVADPGPCEVRVRVRAVAMNHMDLWVRRGMPHLKLDYPHRLGCDVAGELEALGPGARAGKVGDRVWLQPSLSCGVCAACQAGRDNLCKRYRILGENAQGGYGELIVVPDTSLLPIPPHLGFEEAAALPLCTMTAWQAVFRKARVGPEHTVLVHAGGSGVSSIAIQLCKLAGARVVTTVGSPAKADPARALGADHVVITTEQDFVEEVKRLTDKAGVDIVLDHVGGEVFEKSLRAVAWGGRIVTVGATAGFAPKIDLRQVFFRQVEILGSTMGSRGDLAQAATLVAARRIRPVVGRVMALWDARAAHEALESRAVFGKVVLRVAD